MTARPSSLAWTQPDAWHLQAPGYRVSKAIVPGRTVYTAWRQAGTTWDALGYSGTAAEAKAACESDSKGRG